MNIHAPMSFFRSIALPVPQEDSLDKSTHAHGHYTNRRDILNVLQRVQPKLHFETTPIGNNTLWPVAVALASRKCPLDCYFIPRDELVSLVDFLIELLQSITLERGEDPSKLEIRLRKVSKAVAEIPKENLSFADILEAGRPMVVHSVLFRVLIIKLY